MLQIKNTLGGGKPNAPYAWAKYEVYNATGSVTFAQKSRVDGAYEISVTSTEIDTTKLKASDFVGIRLDYESGGYGIVFYADGVCKLENSSGTASGTYSYTYDAIEGIITTTNKFTDDLTFISPTKTVSANDMTFVEYVTDKSPTKYPNGEVHTDGFFYRYAPEGLYVWKKYECIPEQTIVNPTFHIKANVSTQKAIITSDDINFKAFGTLTDSKNFYQSREPEFCNFMNGFNNSNSSVNFAISTSTYSGQLELNYLNNSYWNAFTKMTPTDTGAELTASNLFKTTIDDTLQYTGTKTIAAKIGEFISYVVSDKETAYPNGGEKDGYWYERVSEAKVASGTITLTSKQSTISIEHGLGKTPTKFAIMPINKNFNSVYTLCAMGIDDTIIMEYYDSLLSTPKGYFTSVDKSKVTMNETNLTLPGCYVASQSSTFQWIAGTYHWIAIAE